MCCRAVQNLSGTQVEDGVVPGALDAVVLELAFFEGRAGMGADGAGGVDLALVAVEEDGLAVALEKNGQPKVPTHVRKNGQVVARVHKTLYVRLKPRFRPATG